MDNKVPPLISIITVNLNNKEGLGRTINSVVQQSYLSKEHIIVDGKSKDGSIDKIENRKHLFSNILIEKDKGVYDAMNKGIDLAKGEYLLFLNSGDELFDFNSLELFSPYLINTNKIDLLYGNIKVMAPKSYIKTYPKKLTLNYFFNDTLPHPATLIHRDCFKEMRYDETLKIVSDWKFFMIGIFRRNFIYQHVDAVISRFYLDGISSKHPKLIKQEKQLVLEKEFYLKVKLNKLKSKLKLGSSKN